MIDSHYDFKCFPRSNLLERQTKHDLTSLIPHPVKPLGCFLSVRLDVNQSSNWPFNPYMFTLWRNSDTQLKLYWTLNILCLFDLNCLNMNQVHGKYQLVRYFKICILHVIGQASLLRMVRWMRWHCSPDTWFEIRALAVWGRARYFSFTEAPPQ